MIVLLFPFLVYVFFIFLFFRQVRLDAKRLAHQKQKDNELWLQDMQRYIAEREAEKRLNTSDKL